MIVAVIPARGGSKGIPRKNLALIGGVPLLVHSILHAHQSRLIDLVVVSTDDDEIAAVAADHGAEVVHRPAELASDEAPSEAALSHALGDVRARFDDEDDEVELVVFLQATSPIRQPGDLDGAIERVRSEGADSLFAACPQRGFVWGESSARLRSLTYDFRERRRRQDLGSEHWEENGSFYVFRPWVLERLANRLGGTVAMWPMHPFDGFQVDEPGDLELLTTLLAIRTTPRAPLALEHIRLLCFDFDGVLTDNRVLVDQHGNEAVFCDRGDGWGIARVGELGVAVVIVSTERNDVVAARARKLGVECVHGSSNKAVTLREIAKRHGVPLADVAFVGNDVNDLPALLLVGVPIAVRDARPEVLKASVAITTNDGGRGAAREVCDWIVASHSSNEATDRDHPTGPH
jgi:YrbI family 3-deoxy-D-manno-octulosonate 8-phosphate phosphatase